MTSPLEEAWRSWGFLERLDWAARENSRQGPRLPIWILSVTYGRFILQNVAFLLLLVALPDSKSISSPQDHAWRTFLRYTSWTYALDCTGIRNGPMLDGRFTPWPLGMFTIARYRLTKGALKLSRLPCFGSCRTTLDVVLYVTQMIALAVAVAMPARLEEALIVAVLCASWTFLSDTPQFFASQSTTYFYVLLAGCFPKGQGGLACTQIHVMLVWLGSGLGKIGPWFQFVNGPFLSASIWLRGRAWLWGFLYRGEDDLRPTVAVSMVGSLAPHVEWISPLLLMAVMSPFLIYLGIGALVAMHVYILAAPAARDIYNWNGWFIVAAISLFSGPVSLGFAFSSLSDSPLPLTLLFIGEAFIVILGVLRPDLISYQTGHRNWAGNWSQALVLLKKSAASKLTDSILTYGQPAWDPVPASIQLGPRPAGTDASFARELITYKLLGNYWLGTLNLKGLPTLVQHALPTDSLQDYHVMHGNQLLDTCMGSFFCLSWFPQVVNEIQRAAKFEDGEFVCIHVGSFPFQWSHLQGEAPWQILDASAGVIAKGSLKTETAWILAIQPSACERTKWLLGDHPSAA